MLEYCSEGDLKQFIPKFRKSMSLFNQGSDSTTGQVLTEAEARHVIRDVLQGLHYLST